MPSYTSVRLQAEELINAFQGMQERLAIVEQSAVWFVTTRA
jgi:hypothetical protein